MASELGSLQTLMQSAETRVITLRDGRDLAWVEVGDPTGVPVFAFHGTPGSRLAFATTQATVREAGVRMICPDRPGYGLSSFHFGRRLTDWPSDVGQLADHLQIPRFAVIGVSGGGPHAAACAALLPTRVTRAAIVSGIGPFETPAATEGMMRTNRITMTLARRVPWLLRPLNTMIGWIMRRRPRQAIDMMIKQVPPVDAEVLSRPEVRAGFEYEAAHASRTAGRAAGQDLALFVRDWGFSLADIKVPTRLWQGGVDVNVPPSHGRVQHAAIVGSDLVDCPSEGHMLVFDHLGEILAFLAAP